MKALFIFITIPFIAFKLSFAKTINASISPSTLNQPLSEKGLLILDALRKEIGWKNSEVKEAPKKINKQEPLAKKVTSGMSAIEKIRAQNRKILKKRMGTNTFEQRGSDILKQKMRANRDEIGRSYSVGASEEMAEFNRDFLKKLRIKNKDELKRWQKAIDDTQSFWDQKKKEFLANLKYYKKNLVDFKTEKKISQKELKKPLKQRIEKHFHLIPRALDIKIKDQGRRATCSAFAGIRAVETLLSSHNIHMDLSEQYFYWSSRPDCRTTPCVEKGSWARAGFDYGLGLNKLDIPSEKDCPYIKKSKRGNETQIPLPRNCQQGRAQVASYTKVKTLDQIYNALKENKPVVGAFKLSPNFYKNNGLITYRKALIKGKMNRHSLGHAFLIVGHFKLPPSLAMEGKVCLIIANSWGEGWGKGGFSCITEKWARTFRASNAFLALGSVNI